MVRRTGLAAALLGAVLLAACGSSGGSSGSGASATTAPPGSAASQGTAGASSATAQTLPAAQLTGNLNWDTAAANSSVVKYVGAYPTVSGNTTRGVTDSSIKVEAVVPLTANGVKAPGASVCDGIKARLDRANSAHELSRTVDYLGCTDTGGDPTTTQNDTVKAIDTDGVFAVFGGTLDGTLMENRHSLYLGVANSTVCGTDQKFGFAPLGSSYCPEYNKATGGIIYNDGVLKAFTQVQGLKSYSDIHLTWITDNSPQQVAIIKGYSPIYTALGADVLGTYTDLPAQTGASVDLSPYIAPSLAKNPNLVLVGIDDNPQLQARVIGAYRQAGYKGAIVSGANQDSMKTPAVAAELDGSYSQSVTYGFDVYGGQYWDALKADAGKSGGISNNFTIGWLGADLFVAGLKDFAKTGQALTTENVANFMNANWTWPGFGDVGGALTWPYGKFGANPCSATVQLSAKAQGFVAVPNGDLTCGVVKFGGTPKQ
jgi:hypothetical protein